MAHGLFKFTAAAVVVGAALYAGIGYVGVPYATKITLDKFVSAKIGRPVMLQEVSFNPWSLTYELRGLDIPKKTGGSLLHLDHLLVDASAQTLFKLAPVLDEITIDGLHIDAVMDDALKADIAALAGENGSGSEASPQAVKEENASAGGLPGFALYNISVTNSSIRYADQSLGIDQAVTDVTLKLPFVSTLESSRESLVTPALSLKLNGTPIEASGSTKPFGSSLEAMLALKVDGLDIVPLAKIVPALQSDALYVSNGKLSANLNFIFRNPTGGEPAKMLLAGTSSLSDVSIKQGLGKSAAELAGFSRAGITLKEVNFVTRTAAVENAVLDGLRVNARNTKSGINLLNAAQSAIGASAPNASGAPQPSSEQSSGDSGWQWSVALASVKNSTLNWQDDTLSPSAKIAVKDLGVQLNGLGNNVDKPAQLQASAKLLDGSLAVKGAVGISPLSVNVAVTAEKLSVKSVAGYVKKATGLDVASLADFGVNIKYEDAAQSISGNATLSNIAVKSGKSTIITAKKANTVVKNIDLIAQSAELDSIGIDGLVVNAVNTKNGLNLMQLGAQPGQATSTTTEKANPKNDSDDAAWSWKLGTASLKNSTLNLRDETLKPAASTSITRLNATVKNLSSAPGGRSVVDVALSAAGGTINAAGNFTMSPVSAAVDVKANQLQLKTISPFLKGYAGLGANKGKFAMQGKLSVLEDKPKTAKESSAAAPKTVVAWQGNMSLADLDLTNAKGTSIMSWTKATLTGMDVATTDPIRIVVAKAEIEQPAEKQTKVVREIAGLASLISAVRGKTDTAEKIDKYSSKLEGTITLENIRYVNGKFSADGVNAASVGGIILEKLSKAVSEKL